MRGAGKKFVARVGKCEGARDLCGWHSGREGQGLLQRKALFFGYFFLSQQKKVTPPGGIQ